LPEASFTSVDLSKTIFESKGSKLFLCEYHRKGKDTTYKNDTIVEFFGTGFKGIDSDSDKTPPRVGHLHCGCAIDEVILEFFLWKTSRARSSNLAIDKDFAMAGLEKLKPSTRSFWNKSIRDYTGLRTEVFISPDYGSPIYASRLAMIQLHTQIERLKALRAPLMVQLAFPTPEADKDIPEDLRMYGQETGVYVTGEDMAAEWAKIHGSHPVAPLPFISCATDY
jgi:hypothetical protein